jgi:phosphoesterase RecJ-like protein
MTDTGSFKFPSTTYVTHTVVSNLLKTGISHSEIHNQIYDNNKFERVQLLSFALSKIQIIQNLNTCYISLSQKDLDEYNYQKGDTEGIVNYGLSIKNIKFAVIFMENSKENIIRISLRSRGDFDVNEFSKSIFGGGGHKNAAGAISKKSLKQTIDYFLESLNNYKESLI